MNPTELWTDAWTCAGPAWEAALRHAGWHPAAVAGVQAALALSCLAVARPARGAGGGRPVWGVAAALLLLLALNTLYAVDALVIELMRCAARTGGWYESRRTWQAGALALAGLLALGVGHAVRRQAPRAASERVLATGLALLAGLATLRAVSLHASDAVLHARWAGVSVGRLVDAAGLTLVGVAAWRDRHATAS